MNLSSEEFLSRLAESKVLEPKQLAAFTAKLPKLVRGKNARELAIEFLKADLLTRFQIARILKNDQQSLSIGNIVLEELIGAGGMGTVYKARHRRMQRVVAIKILEKTDGRPEIMLRRFQREVQAAAKLTHPNIVTAYDADEQQGRLFLVMEYVDGVDLGTLTQSEGQLNFQKAINCIAQAARGLQYAHSQSIIHRDIKPGNLLIDGDGVVKILDMGLARNLLPKPDDGTSDVSLTGEHQILGTVDYMSPEQADDSKQVDGRADIYSLGCTLYFLLTGQPPYYRSSIIQTLLAHRSEAIPSVRETRPDLPAEIDELILRMLAKSPDDRYASMSAVLKHLTRFDDDTDFQLVESAGFSFIDEDDSETKVFQPEELLGKQGEGPSNRADSTAILTLSVAKQDTEAEATAWVSNEPTIGIDLGTTFSVIARLDSAGKPEVLRNGEGESLTPSVLLVERDEVVVGKEAVKAMPSAMRSVVESAKRDLGSDAYSRRLHGKCFPPEVLMSWILKKLKQDAEEQLGPIQKAVITVPAYFDEVRRRATQEAGRLANLEVLDIINEPTAAAIRYGRELKERQAKDNPGASQSLQYLVYDLGGGTFDVTLMEVEGSNYRTLATDGDVRLGGRDWDDRILEWAVEQFQQRHDLDPREDPNAYGRLLREAEDVKRTLSARKRTTLAFDFLGKTLNLELTRQSFEAMTSDLLARTEFTVAQTIAAAKSSWSTIDHILLVGGATRMPAVTEMLERISSKKPDRTLNPDESVAEGAALHAGAILSRRSGRPTDLQIQNVNSHSLGVVGRSPATGKRQTAIVIPRNSPLPAQASRVFKTGKAGQNRVVVKIVEGESSDPDACSQVGKCIVSGLPADLPPQSPVKVTFSYDESGRLGVDVEVHRTKFRQEIERYHCLDEESFQYWQRWLESGELEVDEDQLLELDELD